MSLQASEEIPTFRIPIDYKLYLDDAIASQDVDTVIALLTSEKEDNIMYRDNYPLAMKLYRILIVDTRGEDFTQEARYIPIDSITNVARELAVQGGNVLFLMKMGSRQLQNR